MQSGSTTQQDLQLGNQLESSQKLFSEDEKPHFAMSWLASFLNHFAIGAFKNRTRLPSAHFLSSTCLSATKK
jgi:hypothetical protein